MNGVPCRYLAEPSDALSPPRPLLSVSQFAEIPSFVFVRSRLLFFFSALAGEKVVEDADIPDPAATFQRRGGKARRYWGKVNRGVKNFRRRRERRRLQRHQTKGGDVVSGVSRARAV